MLAPSLIGALVVSGLAAMGTMANEGTHGGVSEMMGLGHQHMTDVGGYHCASHMGDHSSDHLEHMHNETHAAHADCPGGAGMHDMDHPMMPGGM